MDLAGIRYIQKAFIKERGAEVFRKNRLSPIMKSPLKILRHFVYSETICQRENENRQQPFI